MNKPSENVFILHQYRYKVVPLRRGSRGGAQGARAPLWKKWGHIICPEPMSFLEGVGRGWGGLQLHGLWKRSKQRYQS